MLQESKASMDSCPECPFEDACIECRFTDFPNDAQEAQIEEELRKFSREIQDKAFEDIFSSSQKYKEPQLNPNTPGFRPLSTALTDGLKWLKSKINNRTD